MLSSALAGLPSWLILTISTVIGLLVGSFLNVVIHRIPLGESIVSPGSACPSCLASIRPWDNIPIISFVLLGGRCRNCRQRISPSYPVVELVAALLFALIVWHHGPTWRSVGEWWFVGTMLVLAVIDARHQVLPDRITYPSLVIAMVATISQSPLLADIDQLIPMADPGGSRWRTALLGASVIVTASAALWLLDQLDIVLFDKYYDWVETGEVAATESDDEGEDRRYARLTRATVLLGLLLGLIWSLVVLVDSPRDPGLYQMACNRIIEAGVGALIGASALWVVRAGYFYLRATEGMGLGDVKLMAVVGAFLGWPGAVLVLLLASIIGLILGLSLARTSGEGLKTKLPLGACLGSAAIIVVILLDVGFYSWI